MKNLTLTIEALKSHVEAYVRSVGQDIGGGFHKVVADFATFVEGREAEQDAINLLTAKGYTINPPPSASNPQ